MAQLFKFNLKMGTHLRYRELDAFNKGERRYPGTVMKELGITYQHSTIQTMADQWWYWNCENIPDELPPFIEVADWDPMEQVGNGLDQEVAESIRDYKT